MHFHLTMASINDFKLNIKYIKHSSSDLLQIKAISNEKRTMANSFANNIHPMSTINGRHLIYAHKKQITTKVTHIQQAKLILLKQKAIITYDD